MTDFAFVFEFDNDMSYVLWICLYDLVLGLDLPS